MTVALASVVGLLAVALVVVAWSSARATRHHEQRHAEAVAAHRAAEAELAESRKAAAEVERRFREGQARAEVAERMRLQREWAELAGPGAALPVAWDASLACAVGSELEIIREVVGTPATLETDGDHRGSGGFRIALAAEFLRAAALDADEMQVGVGDCLVVRASAVVDGTRAATPHLDSIRGLIGDAGAEMIVEAAGSGFTATLRFGG